MTLSNLKKKEKKKRERVLSVPKTPLGELDHVTSVPICIVAPEGKKLPVLLTIQSPMPRIVLAQRKHSINGGTEGICLYYLCISSLKV